MNIKKIGMTALAASLVSTSVFAGELTATGSASITVEGHSGTILQSDTAFSMADSVILSGSTELDNGMTVSMSFELDGASEDADGLSAYDDNSMTISSDAMGTLKFSAHGGSSAASALDTTAAGDVWDNFDTGLTVTGAATKAAGAGENSLYYTLPSMVDGLTVNASLNTAGATGNNALGYNATYSGVDGLTVNASLNTAGATGNNALGYNATYSGVDGLSVSYGMADIETGATTTAGDQTVMKASYAYGPVTASYSNAEYDTGAGNTQALAQEVTSYAVSYTVSDAISVTYGTETIESGLSTETDAEYEKISASYTSGGMTLSVTSADGENIDHSTDSDADYDYWALGLSFAF